MAEGEEQTAASREKRWLLTRTYSELKRRVRQSWKDLDPDRRYAWGWSFGAWTAASLVLTVVLVVGGRALLETRAEAWEAGVLRWMDGQDWLTFNTALWLEGPANGFVMWGLIAASSLLAAWLRKPLLSGTLFLGFGVLYLNIFLGWALWPRDRPNMIADGIASPGALSSYPSGHVAQAVFVYGMFVYLWLRRTRSTTEKIVGYTLLLLIVFVIGFARLRVGSHWPSDLVAGLFIGVFWTVGATRSLAAASRASQ